MEKQSKIDTTMDYVVGAVYALLAGYLTEFSNKGNSGVIEVRVKNGKLQGVHVAKYSEAEVESGIRAGWQLTPEDIAALPQGAKR